jgi:hypothetical protein
MVGFCSWFLAYSRAILVRCRAFLSADSLVALLFNYCGLLVTLVHKGLQVGDYLYWAFVKGKPFCRLILVLLTMWAACVLSRASLHQTTSR